MVDVYFNFGVSGLGEHDLSLFVGYEGSGGIPGTFNWTFAARHSGVREVEGKFSWKLCLFGLHVAHHVTQTRQIGSQNIDLQDIKILTHTMSFSYQ